MMLPEKDRSATEYGPAVKPGRRASRRAAQDGGAEPPTARILQLVAALKAEQEAPLPLQPPANDAGERVRLMQSLKQILAAREDERGAWTARVSELEAQLKAAESLAASARAAVAEATAQHERLVGETTAQHERLVADLKLMHEHQRSIWQLELRQLEITLGALQKAQQRRLLPRLARPAMVAALLLVFLAAVALSSDSNARGADGGFYFDDVGHTAMILWRGN
ncbi:MAG TPA: hypothetical protein VE397_10670 [Stellaceae bacterium]|nr:hypothetical protein [Stellaceae bacterium]